MNLSLSLNGNKAVLEKDYLKEYCPELSIILLKPEKNIYLNLNNPIILKKENKRINVYVFN